MVLPVSLVADYGDARGMPKVLPVGFSRFPNPSCQVFSDMKKANPRLKINMPSWFPCRKTSVIFLEKKHAMLFLPLQKTAVTFLLKQKSAKGVICSFATDPSGVWAVPD